MVLDGCGVTVYFLVQYLFLLPNEMSKRYSRYLLVVLVVMLSASLYYYQQRLDFKNRYLDFRQNKIEQEFGKSHNSSRPTLLQNNNRLLAEYNKGKNTTTFPKTSSHDNHFKTHDVVNDSDVKRNDTQTVTSAVLRTESHPDSKQVNSLETNYRSGNQSENSTSHLKGNDTKVLTADKIGSQIEKVKIDGIVVSENERKLANLQNSSKDPLVTGKTNGSTGKAAKHVSGNQEVTPSPPKLINVTSISKNSKRGMPTMLKPNVVDRIDKQVISTNSIKQTNASNGIRETSDSSKCKPSTRIVFLKTHKTGSSTITSIFQRFGFLRNLSFVLPSQGHVISAGLYKRPIVRRKYDMLVNHVRYNRKEMDAVMKPDTKYITILRDPATQAESIFGYFQIFRHLNLSQRANPFEQFISKPQYFLDKYEKFSMRNYLKNPLLYDLGLDPSEHSNVDKVQLHIKTIAREFSLVLLQEYFNESLLLLKKLLCWDMDDILYIIKGVRVTNLRFGLSDNLKQKSRDWNSADVILYDFFNKTFWQKVAEYGPDFKKDLKEFDDKLNSTFSDCTMLDDRPLVDHRAYTYKVNPVSGQTCRYMLLSDEQFTGTIRRAAMISMMSKYDNRYHSRSKFYKPRPVSTPKRYPIKRHKPHRPI
ncbi:uncharacterized protein [Antedon mediterranea]|uniref:uncharacterized protein n=1 Tax=Antedon mediterranea TaxID=105859 RepID=UPI003AF7904A